MPLNLLLLPILGGYYILTRSYIFKFTQQRLDKQRLIFTSVMVGVVVGLLAFTVRFICTLFCPSYLSLIRGFIPLSSPNYLLTSIITFLSAIIFVQFTNLFINKERQMSRTIRKVGSEVELLFLYSQEKNKTLLITLDNGQFYVGWVMELPIPSISGSVRILPLASGQINANGIYIVCIHYLSFYKKIEKKDLPMSELGGDLAIQVESIISVSYYEDELNQLDFGSVKSMS